MYRPGKADNDKRGKGGKRPGAGRKSKEEAEVLAKFAKNLKRAINRRQKNLIKAYLDFAEADPASARDLVSKVLASQVAVVGQDGQPLVPVTIVTVDANEEWRNRK
jgi:hypothetical protein